MLKESYSNTENERKPIFLYIFFVIFFCIIMNIILYKIISWQNLKKLSNNNGHVIIMQLISNYRFCIFSYSIFMYLMLRKQFLYILQSATYNFSLSNSAYQFRLSVAINWFLVSLFIVWLAASVSGQICKFIQICKHLRSEFSIRLIWRVHTYAQFSSVQFSP